MFGHNFYWGLTRKYVSYFGTVFNDIYITRSIPGSGVESDRIKVPLSYAPKKKITLRFEQDPEINRPDAITLPRMSFEITNMTYDGSRKIPMLQRYVEMNTSDSTRMYHMYEAVPYNIDFNLYVYVKYTEDGLKIIEQIMPFFAPEWTASVQLIPEMGISKDIPIILTNYSVEDSYDGSFKERQILVHTLSFQMKAWFYGPKYDKPIIIFSKQRYWAPTGNIDPTDVTNAIGTIDVRPGLTANGTPTSNAAESVAANTIFVDDDFGYIIEVSGLVVTE